ncbi:MAG: sensor histidine kinase [Thermoanaerobaculaceae bacterium]
MATVETQEAQLFLARLLSPRELTLQRENGEPESFRCAEPLASPTPVGTRVEIENPERRLSVRLFPIAGSTELVVAVTDQAAGALCAEWLGDLVNHIAHDLRNLFFTVSLQAEIASRSPSQAKPHLDIILNQLARVQQYLERLLLYGRKLSLSLATLDVDTFLREKLRVFRASWPEDQPPLSFNLTVEGEAGVARWDPQLLGYALEAVLDNAARATAPRQTVDIRVVGEKQRVCVEIKDHGPGIPAKDLDKVFLPMAVRRPHGLGLGLPTAKKLVEAHGGRLSLFTSSSGTIVSIVLPRQANER